MNQDHYQAAVHEFMTSFKQDCPEKPIVPSANIRILRVKLLLEEVLELAEASGVSLLETSGYKITSESLKEGQISLVDNGENTNLTEVADALADISYVNYGAANAYGIDLAPVEAEVHASNMSKLFSTDDLRYVDEGLFNIDKVIDGLYVVKNKDGKVMKSPSYFPAKIEDIILKQQMV